MKLNHITSEAKFKLRDIKNYKQTVYWYKIKL